MKAIIGGVLMAMCLAGAASAQEQSAAFTRISGRFVKLQSVQDRSESASAFRFARSEVREDARPEQESAKVAAPAAKVVAAVIAPSAPAPRPAPSR